MKHLNKLAFIATAAIASLTFVGCADEEFTDSIFNTNASIDYLDKSSYSFPLDTFCKKEFLEPYNMSFLYKFDDRGSDMNKNLTPARYTKCVDLAVLTKYLWYDVYKKVAGEEFLKKYSPRVLNITGSKNYNPSQGTETLGDASNGIKINLYNVNNLEYNDIELMNEYFFKTMHHEFSHILDQTYIHPTAFNTISNSQYDASGWSDTPDSIKAGLGFTSSYASSAKDEDWAETMANYITMDTLQWVKLLNSASYEWEEIDCSSRVEYAMMCKPGCNLDTVGYYDERDNGENKVYRRKCLRDADGSVVLDNKESSLFKGTHKFDASHSTWEIPGLNLSKVKAGAKLRIKGEPSITAEDCAFDLVNGSTTVVSGLKWDVSTITMSMEINITQEMIDQVSTSSSKSLTISGKGFVIKEISLFEKGEPTWLHVTGIDGRATILRKVDMVRAYLREYYNISLDDLRREVQTRTFLTDDKGNFVLDNGKLSNRLRWTADDQGVILMDQLRNLVYKYKELQK